MLFRLSFCLTFFSLSSFVFAQEYQPALAFSLPPIEVDGQLDDWPVDIPAYPIAAVAFGELSGPDDLKAVFRAGYRAEERALYLAVEIVDSEAIDADSGGVIDNVDHLLLYLDPIHHANGGSRMLFLAGTQLRDFSKPARKVWSPDTPQIDWEKVQHRAHHPESGETIHEWRFELGDYFNSGAVLGLDFIVADADHTPEGNSWVTWKPGTGKSEGAQRLGEVLLVPEDAKTGLLKGTISTVSKHIPEIKSVMVSAADNPACRLRVPVDSTGQYECRLPAGCYEVTSGVRFTSPIVTEDFFQNTHKIREVSLVSVEVSAGETVSALPLILDVAPLPGGLFEEEGVLVQPSFSDHKISRFIEAFQAYYDIPGISVALLREGKVVYDRTFGVKSSLTRQPLEPNTLFEGASITKAVFALMVLKLAEGGKLDLDRPAYQYLRFPNLEHDERYKTLTARHILNHQSGMDNWPVGSYSGNLNDNEVKFNFTPGTDFGYSGEAINYLGRIVESITGKSLKDLFQEELAPAFDLRHTYFSFTDELSDEIAMGHWQDFVRYKSKFSGVDSPASSIQTSAHDFTNLMLGLLAKKYLNKSSYNLITKHHQPLVREKRFYDADWEQGIAHGFFVTETPLGKAIGHGGNNGDFDCKFTLFPESGYGYVVFTNSNLGDEFIRLLELYLFQGHESYDREFGSLVDEK